MLNVTLLNSVYYCEVNKCHGQTDSTSDPYLKVLGAFLGLKTHCPDCYFLWFSSVTPANSRIVP
jgi:hypothetical protein